MGALGFACGLRGICATDLHILSGKLRSASAHLGHEISGGTVEAVGEGVASSWIGRNVIVDPVIGCGVCPFCRSGRKLLCRMAANSGTTGGDGGGGYAEHVIVPATNLYLMPEQLSFEEAALVEPLNCTFRRVLQSPPQAGRVGARFRERAGGTIVRELARASGCAPVSWWVAALRAARRLDGSWVPQNHGVTWTTGFCDRVLGVTNGEGPDIAIEAFGSRCRRPPSLPVGPARRTCRTVWHLWRQKPGISSDQVVSKELNSSQASDHLSPYSG